MSDGTQATSIPRAGMFATVRNRRGIVSAVEPFDGESGRLHLVHTGDVRPSQVLYELVSQLVLTKWRDPGEDPKLHLFGQLKRIARQWLEGYLVCKGGTCPR